MFFDFFMTFFFFNDVNVPVFRIRMFLGLLDPHPDPYQNFKDSQHCWASWLPSRSTVVHRSSIRQPYPPPPTSRRRWGAPWHCPPAQRACSPWRSSAAEATPAGSGLLCQTPDSAIRRRSRIYTLMLQEEHMGCKPKKKVKNTLRSYVNSTNVCILFLDILPVFLKVPYTRKRIFLVPIFNFVLFNCYLWLNLKILVKKLFDCSAWF